MDPYEVSIKNYNWQSLAITKIPGKNSEWLTAMAAEEIELTFNVLKKTIIEHHLC